MTQRPLSLLTLAAALIALLVSVFALTRTSAPDAAVSQSHLDRVREKRELRVGYIVFPPYISRDSRSGRMSGIFATFTEELAKNLGAKLTWVEEVNLTNLSAGLDTNRFDMIVTPLWRSADRAKAVQFSTPLFYSVVGTYVRSNDTRFDSNLRGINDPRITVAAIDGELAGEIARTDFPKARLSELPQLVDYSQLMTEVASGKADVTFYNRIFAKRFMRQNPGKIREVDAVPPIRVFAECFIYPIADPRFAAAIDSSLLELLDNGALERALATNGENPREYYLRSKPFQEPQT